MRWVARLAALVLLLLPVLAEAGTPNCSVGSVVGVAFGDYDPFSALPLDAAGSVSFTCDGFGAADTVLVALSTGGSGSYSSRTLLWGSAVLQYNLYLDAARTLVWGDGSEGSAAWGPTTPVNGQAVSIPIYGRVAARQNASPGSYADTLVVTFTF